VPREKRRCVTGHSLGKGTDSTVYIDRDAYTAKELLEEVIAEIDFHKTLGLDFLGKSRFVIQ